MSRVYVDNLYPQVTERALEDEFRTYGVIRRPPGYAFIDFDDRRDAEDTIRELDACAIVLTFVMGQRYMQTSKIMPAGVVAGISVVMTGFYLFKIATGGNHFPAKAE